MEHQTEREPLCSRGGCNAYPPADTVLRAVRKGIQRGLNQNSGDISAVTAAFAKELKISADKIITVAGRKIALKMLFNKVDRLWLPACSEPCYGTLAVAFGIKITEMPLMDDASVDFAAAGAKGTVLLANPGYPIGKGLDIEALADFLKSRKDTVIVDETYFGFGAVSVLPLVEKYDNLAVIRSLEITNALTALPVACIITRNPQALKNSAFIEPPCPLALTAAEASLKAKRTATARCNTLRAVREGTAVALRGIGFDVIPSSGNFFLMKYWNRSAQEIALHLTEQGYLVDTVRLMGEEWVSVTVGTKEAMRNWVDIVESFIEEEWVIHRFDEM